MEDFLKYCCLSKKLSALHDTATPQEFSHLITPCYNGDPNFQNSNQTFRIRNAISFFKLNVNKFNTSLCPYEKMIDPCNQSTKPEFVLYVCVLVLLLAMIVCSNLVVIMAIYKVPNLRKSIPNLFIMSLSFSDLLVGLFVIPIKILFAKSNMMFCMSMSVCRMYIIAETSVYVTSIANLLVISVDRHFALNYPQKYQKWMTRKKSKIIIAITWFYGAFCGSLTNLKFDNTSKDAIKIDNGNCSMSNNSYYVFLLYTLNFLIPVVVMGLIYSRIFIISKRVVNKIEGEKEDGEMNKSYEDSDGININSSISNKSENKSRNNSNNNDNNGNNHGHNNKFEEEKIRRKSFPQYFTTSFTDSKANKEHKKGTIGDVEEMGKGQSQKLVLKTSKTFAVVYGTFVMCWLPVCTFSIALTICRPCFSSVNIWFYIICIEMLPFINSMLNVFIYAITSKQFRKGFKTLYGLIFRRRNTSTNEA